MSDWSEILQPYEEGARTKSVMYCPPAATYSFLIPNHRYMFKLPRERYPQQHWAEIMAYQIGCLMGVPVPPAFIAYDAKQNTSGALIEWFFEYPGEPTEQYTRGGDLFQKIMPDYNRKTGEEHNLSDLINIVEGAGIPSVRVIPYWAKVLSFDAIIGNTDRHQDNWGLLQLGQQASFAPAFDNSTAMGHERFDDKLKSVLDNIKAYITGKKARHHMRWSKGQPPLSHFELIEKVMVRWPQSAAYIQETLSFEPESLRPAFNELIELSLEIPIVNQRLTLERVDFIIKLAAARKEQLESLVKKK